jgi:hypothetical protein
VGEHSLAAVRAEEQMTLRRQAVSRRGPSLHVEERASLGAIAGVAAQRAWRLVYASCSDHGICSP